MTDKTERYQSIIAEQLMQLVTCCHLFSMPSQLFSENSRAISCHFRGKKSTPCSRIVLAFGRSYPAAMTPGLIPLSDIIGRLRYLRVECKECGRAGRYSVARLAREWPPSKALAEIIAPLNTDCPLKRAPDLAKRCKVQMPDLSELIDGRPRA
jgi:hypothetical protein